MIFLLHSNGFSERGDSVTLLELANQLSNNFKFKVFIAVPAFATEVSDLRVREANLAGIEIFRYLDREDLLTFVQQNKVTHTYVFSGGKKTDLAYFDFTEPESFRLGNTIHITHVVFKNFAPHGEVYAYVSQWLYGWSKRTLRFLLWRFSCVLRGFNPTKIIAFPHFVTVPNEIKTDLDICKLFKIPPESIVIGRIGGFNELSDPAAKRAIKALLKSNPRIHVVCVNTATFYKHDRLHFLKFLDRSDVWSFYQSCDVLLNGRLMGESFGYSILEPLSIGKPVIAPHWIRNPLMDRNHIQILKPLGYLYKSKRNLLKIIDDILTNPYDSSRLRRRVEDFNGTKAVTALLEALSERDIE